MPIAPDAAARSCIDTIVLDGTSLFECETGRADEPVIESLPLIEIVCDQVDLAVAPDTRLTVVTHSSALRESAGSSWAPLQLDRPSRGRADSPSWVAPPRRCPAYCHQRQVLADFLLGTLVMSRVANRPPSRTATDMTWRAGTSRAGLSAVGVTS
jgi:hypothetical protein